MLRAERRRVLISEQGIDVGLQVHDLSQFLADKFARLFGIPPLFLWHIHSTLLRNKVIG
jgi:hypothetical protein